MDDTSAAAAFEAIDDGEVEAGGTGCDKGVKQCDHLEKLESLCVPATMSKGSVLLWSEAQSTVRLLILPAREATNMIETVRRDGA